MSVVSWLMPLCLAGVEPSCGLVDANGHWAIEPRYKTLQINGVGFTAGASGGRVALLDARGTPVGDGRWREVGMFSEGLAPATSADPPYLQGYIDTAGRWAIEPQFHQARAFRDGLAAVMLASSGGDTVHMRYVRRDGSFAFAQTFSDAGSFEGGMAQAMPAGATGSGVLDTQGRWIVEPKPDQSVRIHERSDAEREADPQGETHAVIVTAQGQSLVDRRGRRLVSTNGSDSDIRPAGEGRAFVNPTDEDHMGLFDTSSGRMLVQPQTRWYSSGRYMQGLALAHTGDQGSGYVDRQGRWALPPRWAFATGFDRGLAVASQRPAAPGGNALVGLINRSGRWVLDPAWLYMRSRQDGGVNGRLQLPAGVFEATPPDQPEPATTSPQSADQALAAAATTPKDWRPVRSFFVQQGETVRRLADVRAHPCGFDVLIDGGGQAQGIDDVRARCLLAARLDDAAIAALPDDLRRALKAARHAASLHRVTALRGDAGSGGVLAELRAEAVRRSHPELARREAKAAELVKAAPWVAGPADVVIDEETGATFAVPEGLRLLPPAAGRRLRDALKALRSEPLAEPEILKQLDAELAAGRISVDAHAKQRAAIAQLLPAQAASAPLTEEDRHFEQQLAEVSFGLIEPVHRGWLASVAVQRTGAVRLSSPGDPASLLETLKLYQSMRGVPLQPNGVPNFGASSYAIYEWELEPKLDRAAATFEFAFASRGSAQREAVYSSVSFGRAHAAVVQAKLSGFLMDELVEAYLGDIRALHGAVRFPEGQRHKDVQPGDTQSRLRLDELVTGPRPEALKRFGEAVNRVERRHESRIQGLWLQVGLIGLAIMGVWIASRSHRRSEGRTAKRA